MPKVPSGLRLEGALKRRTQGREIEVIANGNHVGLEEELRQHQPEELRTEALRATDGGVLAFLPGAAVSAASSPL